MMLTMGAGRGAGLKEYLKEAFLYRWNLLMFLAGASAAVLSPWPDAMLLMVGAAELTYLTGLISIPRFRNAIDAKAHGRSTDSAWQSTSAGPRSLEEMIAGLSPEARERFKQLRARCLEMRAIAHGVRGQAAAGDARSGEEIATPALDRLLWVFLRLLVSQQALQRFLRSTSPDEVGRRVEDLRTKLANSKATSDERIVRALEDSIATMELRLDNYRKAEKNAQFVSIELDRIEGKVQALTEMAVNRQDPDFLTSQVDSVAESMRQTEKTMGELQQITGLVSELEEPPPILEASPKVLARD